MASVLFALSVLFVFLSGFIFPAGAASAEVFFNAGARATYEDNVVGLASDTGTKGHMSGGGMMKVPAGMSSFTGHGSGDFSLSTSFNVGKRKRLSERAYMLLDGFLSHTSFRKFNQFDYTTVGVGAGAGRSFGKVLSGRVSLTGKYKSHEDSSHSGAALGIGAGLSEMIEPFLIRESYEFEYNGAGSSSSSYIGNSFIIGADYFSGRYTFTLEYGYLMRGYDDNTELTAGTVSAAVEKEIGENWTADIRYDRQQSETDLSGGSAVDNIFSVGVRFIY